MTALALLVLAAVLGSYAVYTQYGNTLPGEPVYKRVWLSVVAGAFAAGTAFVHWLHSVTGP